MIQHEVVSPDAQTASSHSSIPLSTPPLTSIGPRFLPGSLIGQRYRVIGPVGKGGMGEVYRADDLDLGQPVALKFLNAQLANDPAAVGRLRNEVRLARQVAHPNVCRVYDIAEVEGQCFLTMEYVDGEDLSSILRRLGRPSKEKSLQIARQLCAGLGAAHESGILHRDLKPSNVMIDGRGRVRITDFGVAAAVHDVRAGEVTAGTPQYMAPEQLAGRECTSRSDIYSLGLVLYEIFFGKPVFGSMTIRELQELHEGGGPKAPVDTEAEIETEIARVIFWCLEEDAQRRPPSALAVFATLPGGDPLAELLKSGDTPSPEMVAAAGGRGGISAGWGLAALAALVVGVAAIAWLNNRTALFRLAPPTKPAVVLADRARDILRQVGHPAMVDEAYGLMPNGPYLDHIAKKDFAPDRWQKLAGRRPTAHTFWYRASPEGLLSERWVGRVLPEDPAPMEPGMAGVSLDTEGRLVELEIIPRREMSGIAASTNAFGQAEIASLFSLAGLEFRDFRPVQPSWVPRTFADRLLAWDGNYPGEQAKVHVEAAFLNGRPVHFQVVDPYSAPTEKIVMERSGGGTAGLIAVLGVLLALLGGSIWIARRNLRLGRGDRKSALRLGTTVCVMYLLSSLLISHFARDPSFILGVAGMGLAIAVLMGLLAGCAYLALEPYARRVWPEMLISWTRLLLGRWRDARVGRDILIGAVAGVAMIVLQRLEPLVPVWFGKNGRGPLGTEMQIMLGGREPFAVLFDAGFLMSPIVVLLLLSALRFLVRRQWAAIAVGFILLCAGDSHWRSVGVFHAAGIAAAIELTLVIAVELAVLIRYGLLALASAYFFAFLLQKWPLTLDPSAWYASSSMLLVTVLAAVSLYAFRIAAVRHAQYAGGSAILPESAYD